MDPRNRWRRMMEMERRMIEEVFSVTKRLRIREQEKTRELIREDEEGNKGNTAEGMLRLPDGESIV
jgi:hypothetical protein